MSDLTRCPYCGEEIMAGAVKCKHCHSMLNISAASNIGDKLENAGKTMQGIGCLLTIVITIPILFMLFLGGC
jgi:hypothetical protein